MGYEYKEDFEGLGTMKKFVDESANLFTALNGREVIMPPSYSGRPVSIEIEKDKLVLDFGDALVFSLNNVRWVLTGDVAYNYYSAEVVGGQLVITVNASSICD